MAPFNISCIIPVCDRTIFLPEAINSILNQTVKPYEIIVVNNGKDRLKLSESFAEKVTIYDMLPYAGVAQAINFGSSLSKGEYLAFLEDDDLWNERYLENVLNEIKKGKKCIVSRVDKIVDGKISLYKNIYGKLSIDNLLIYNPGVNISNTVISKGLFFEVGGYDPRLPTSADKSLAIEVLRKGEAIWILPENQEIARFHTGPRLGKTPERVQESIFQFLHKYSKIMTFRQKIANWKKFFRYKG